MVCFIDRAPNALMPVCGAACERCVNRPELEGGVVVGGGGDLGPKSLCTKNGLTRFSQRQISFCPTMVT